MYLGSAHYMREQAMAVIDQGCTTAMSTETCRCFMRIHREEQPLESFWVDMFSTNGMQNVERAHMRIKRECRIVRNERYSRAMKRRQRRN
jgi:hypothetical protein